MEFFSSSLSDPLNSILISVSVVSFLIYKYLKRKFCYWCSRGIPCLHPLKCLMNSARVLFHRSHWAMILAEQYKDLSSHKFGGVYYLAKPYFLLRDPELIEEWLVRNFNNFHDRSPPPNEELDPVAANLFSLTGERWRLIRQKLSPAFSSSKVKIMYESLKDCAAELNEYLDMCVTGIGNCDLDIHELMCNYSLEMIGTCGMGVKLNAINDPNSETKKLMMEAFKFNFRRTFYFALEAIHPKLPKLIGLRAVRPEVVDFIKNICKEAEDMKAQGKSSARKDFLQILIDLRDEHEQKPLGSGQENQLPASKFNFEDANEGKEIISGESSGIAFTENVLIGAMGSFMTSGADPIASALTFCLYELALHPEIQEKILDEIRSVKKDASNDMSYDDLSKLKYSTQVIHETLRKYPVGGFLCRVCTEPFSIPGTTKVVEKGVGVFIPTYALHHDHKFFPDPEKFDPDRFSEENIGNIQSGTYIPFGEGPRFCIEIKTHGKKRLVKIRIPDFGTCYSCYGKLDQKHGTFTDTLSKIDMQSAARFVIITVKTMLITVVTNYVLRTCSKTHKEMKFDKSVLSLSPDRGLWLQVEKRRKLIGDR